MAPYLRAHIKDADFATRFGELQEMKREQSVDVNAAVQSIIDDVRARGDAALIELTEKFDRQTISPESLQISEAEIDAAVARQQSFSRGVLAAALSLPCPRV